MLGKLDQCHTAMEPWQTESISNNIEEINWKYASLLRTYRQWKQYDKVKHDQPMWWGEAEP